MAAVDYGHQTNSLRRPDAAVLDAPTAWRFRKEMGVVTG